MSVEILPRERGVVLVCNGCGTRVMTAMCGRKENRAYWRSQGWGRGSDPGAPFREARPQIRNVDGKVVQRALAALPGRPRTTAHDLCPACLPADRAARDARAAKRAARLARPIGGGA